MNLNELYPFAEDRKSRKRVGRGSGSGLGCTSGKGNKGQNARAGGGVRPGFEGGQMPLIRRIAKRGFYNPFSTHYAIVNVADLAAFEAGSVVDFAALKAAGLVKKELDGLKVLGEGELNVALTVKAAKFTQTAREKIEAAGGKAEVI